MSRTPDERRRAELLDAVLKYIVANGLSDLSLRPLAEAVGSSPRVLLYYFGSKEELITEALERIGGRQRDLFARLKTQHMGTDEACRAIWGILSAPASEPIFRLFFEIYGLALQDRKRFSRFLKHVVADWLAFIGGPLVAAGCSKRDAEAFATVVIAGFRGFLLDLCATRDRERVNAAVGMWLDMLNVPPAAKGKVS